MCRNFAFVALLMLSFNLQAGDLPRVSREQLPDYWSLDQSRMAPTLPADLAALADKYGGNLCYSYEVTINEDGRPVDYNLLGISPSSAIQEVDKIRVTVMFERFIPGPRNHEAKPVRVIGENQRIWKPGIHDRHPCEAQKLDKE